MFTNNRNKAKPFRPIRVVDSPAGPMPHWQDNMRLGAKGEHVNSTGCYGIKTTFAIRVKMYGPQKGKRKDSRPKNGGRLVSREQLVRSQSQLISHLEVLRGKLLTVRTIGDFMEHDLLGDLQPELTKITQFLLSHLDPLRVAKMREMDQHRESSTLGRIRKNGIGRVELGAIAAEVRYMVQNVKGLV